MDNTLRVWMEQHAHIQIEDEEDTYTISGILKADEFEMTLSEITSEKNKEITENTINKIRAIIQKSNQENDIKIKIIE